MSTRTFILAVTGCAFVVAACGSCGSYGTSVVEAGPTDVASVSVDVTPSAIVVGQTALATATLQDPSGRTVSGKTVTWESSDLTVATVDTAGTVKAKGPGTTKIKASSSGRSNSSVLSVSAPTTIPVASVAVSPPSATLQVGATVQLSAVTYDSANNVLTGRLISWTSNNPGIATVSSSGLVTAVALGSATITASSEGQMASAAITVSGAAVASVTVSPATASLQVGGSVQLSATTRDANNNVLTGRVVTWGSSNTAISTVSASGLVTAVAAGTATITATSETKTGTATITVTAPAVASVTVSPATASLQVGGTVQLSATTRDANNNVLTGRVVTWSSSNTGISTVSASGLVTAVAAGTATITALSETKTGTAAITVSAPAPVPVASVSVSPSTATVLVGGTVQFSAVTRDANNNILTGRSITWNSSNIAVATVSASGLGTAVAAGTVQITATSEGKSASATQTDTAPSAAPPPPSGTSNEPAGMTFIDQRPFNTLDENASPHSPAWDTDSTLTIVQDATAPISPSNVIRVTYPTGFVAGSAPGHAGVYFGPTGYKTFYIRFAAKLSLNFYGQQSSYSKFFYVWQNNSSLEGFYFAAHGTGTDPLEPDTFLQGITSFPVVNGTPTGNLAPNLVPTALIIRGQWQIFEFVLVGNSAGTADGSVDWYVDGVHVGSVGGIQWTPGAATFSQMDFRPVWGGAGGTVPATMTMDWDHVYMSGKN